MRRQQGEREPLSVQKSRRGLPLASWSLSHPPVLLSPCPSCPLSPSHPVAHSVALAHRIVYSVALLTHWMALWTPVIALWMAQQSLLLTAAAVGGSQHSLPLLTATAVGGSQHSLSLCGWLSTLTVAVWVALRSTTRTETLCCQNANFITWFLSLPNTSLPPRLYLCHLIAATSSLPLPCLCC